MAEPLQLSLPESFWEVEGRRLAVLIVPRLTALALEGARRGSDKIGIGFNYGIYNLLAEQWAREYTDALLKQVRTTNEAVVGDILARWISTVGSTFGDLHAALQPYFGIKRASTIAVTEATRAMASGELLAYQRAGIEKIQWGTNKDELVCPFCGGVNREVRTIGEPFGHFRWRKGQQPEPVYAPPYHPNCRCGISPVLASVSVRKTVLILTDAAIVARTLRTLPPILAKGDFDGHPFRGNQWTEVEKGVDSRGALWRRYSVKDENGNATKNYVYTVSGGEDIPEPLAEAINKNTGEGWRLVRFNYNAKSKTWHIADAGEDDVPTHGMFANESMESNGTVADDLVRGFYDIEQNAISIYDFTGFDNDNLIRTKATERYLRSAERNLFTFNGEKPQVLFLTLDDMQLAAGPGDLFKHDGPGAHDNGSPQAVHGGEKSNASTSVVFEYDDENTMRETLEAFKSAFDKIPESERSKSAVKKIIVFDNAEDVYRALEELNAEDLSDVENGERVHGFYDFNTNTLYASFWDTRISANSLNTFYHEFGHSVVGRDEERTIVYSQAMFPLDKASGPGDLAKHQGPGAHDNGSPQAVHGGALYELESDAIVFTADDSDIYDFVSSELEDGGWEGYRAGIAQDAIEQVSEYGQGLMLEDNGEIVAVSAFAIEETELIGKKELPKALKKDASIVAISFLATKRKGYGREAMQNVVDYAAGEGLGIWLHAVPDAFGYYEAIGMHKHNPYKQDAATYFYWTSDEVKKMARLQKAADRHAGGVPDADEPEGGLVIVPRGYVMKQGLAKGDFVGHPFRGNQHTGGRSFTVNARDIGSATARAEFNGSVSIDPVKWAGMSPISRRGVMAHEIAHQTVEDFVLNNNDEWDMAVDALTMEMNAKGDRLFIGGNTRIGEAITDAVSVYVTGDQFGREPEGWRDWAAGVVERSGHNKEQLLQWTEQALRDADKIAGLAKGDFEGHPFRGNQWTGKYQTNIETVKYKVYPYELKVDRNVVAGDPEEPNSDFVNGYDDLYDIVPQRPWDDRSQPEIVWRSMSAYEYENIKRTGLIQSTGSMSFHDQQGMTFYGSDPSRMYAEDNFKSRVIENHIRERHPDFPTPRLGDVAYIIGIRTPADIKRNQQGEYFTTEPTPASEILRVIEARPGTYNPKERSFGFFGYREVNYDVD